jgi:uncharacterized protein with HEPN domain
VAQNEPEAGEIPAVEQLRKAGFEEGHVIQCLHIRAKILAPGGQSIGLQQAGDDRGIRFGIQAVRIVARHGGTHLRIQIPHGSPPVLELRASEVEFQAQRARLQAAFVTLTWEASGMSKDSPVRAAASTVLITLGEAAARVSNEHKDFAESHPEIPWGKMRGMRNRMAHGYFDIDLQIV